jgi:hypothetical protein
MRGKSKEWRSPMLEVVISRLSGNAAQRKEYSESRDGSQRTEIQLFPIIKLTEEGESLELQASGIGATRSPNQRYGLAFTKGW